MSTKSSINKVLLFLIYLIIKTNRVLASFQTRHLIMVMRFVHWNIFMFKITSTIYWENRKNRKSKCLHWNFTLYVTFTCGSIVLVRTLVSSVYRSNKSDMHEMNSRMFLNFLDVLWNMQNNLQLFFEKTFMLLKPP